MFRRALGNELRVVRKQRGWTRQDLLDHLDHTVALQTLATYEQGTRNCPITRFIEITEALNRSPLDLLRRAYERMCTEADMTGCIVDLVAVARLERPELAPLRRWAQCRLRTHRAAKHPTVRLNLTALHLMAELCSLTTADVIVAALTCQPRGSDNEDTE